MDDNSVAPDGRTPEELDAIADSGEKATNRERPMTEEKDPQPSKDAKDAKLAAKEEFEFIHNGKPIKGTREQILRWAQMGYDRPQFAQKFNLEKQQWLKEKADIESQRQKYSPYLEIDQWASKNPSDWQRLEALWKQANTQPGYLGQQGPQTTQPGAIAPEMQPYLSKIQSLEQQISQIMPTLQQITEERQTNLQKAEDSKLDQEIQSIRGEYKDLDWDLLDENGKSLEMRVLEHAQTHGISKFSAAFRDLLHGELISRAQATAKQSIAKNIQHRTKLGVLGESPTPQSRMPERSKTIRDTSYEELEGDILEMIRMGKVS